MGTDNSRRSFFSRFGLGALSLFAMPQVGWGREAQARKKAIKQVKALGFQWETADPFLFCVHHEDYFPKGNGRMGPDPSLLEGRDIGSDFIIKDGWRMYHGQEVPGFPHHPHRGFETITVVRKGMVDHADSLGASGRYGDGDVQWMTAGKGVQHSEMFPLIHNDKDNPMELFQIWLNLPRKNKMVNAHYKMLWRETIPRVEYTDGNGKKIRTEVIAGSLDGHHAPTPPPDSWAALHENEIGIWNIKMESGAHWVLPPAKEGINRTIYFYEGPSIKMAGQTIEHYHAVSVEADVPINIENGNQEAGLLVLQGRPINEPVVQYGPFVMNTKDEIRQAYEDYHRTQFGGWPWPQKGQVHAGTKGRFARHADGKTIEKS